MDIASNIKIDFMKYRKVFVWLSLALLLVAAGELWFIGDSINYGIDFKGGTQLTIRFKDTPEIDELRRVLEASGQRDALIQSYGKADSNEVLIKTPVVVGSEEGSSAAVIKALSEALNGSAESFDLNQRGREALESLLFDHDPDQMKASTSEIEARNYYAPIAEAVVDVREASGIFTSWDEVRAVASVTPSIAETLESSTTLGAFHILQNDNVGPQIGSELRRNGIIAVVFSLFGMLAYIWFRFELRFGVGALVATFHDFLITLGLYALINYEFNVSTIAAFLTLVGYSVNDTVVIFDRVRENMRRYRRMDLIEVMNLSLNQTMSRTILTSGTTLVAVACLFFFGGEVLRGFAFVLLVGVVIGTYSSVFIACPFAVLWEQLFGDKTAK